MLLVSYMCFRFFSDVFRFKCGGVMQTFGEAHISVEIAGTTDAPSGGRVECFKILHCLGHGSRDRV